MTFEAAWRAVRPLLDAALAEAGRTHELADVEAQVARGDAQLWTGGKSAAVTTLEQDPQERRLLVWLAGGDLDELRHVMLPRMEAFARAHGCQRLMVIGRAGWERALKPQGFAPVARLIAKDL